MSKKLLFIFTRESKDKTSLETDQIFIDGVTKVTELPTKGVVDWILFNLGTEKVLLFENVPVAGNTSFTLPKSSPLAYAKNIKIRWETDYQATRNINDAPTLTA